jgi:hypothetical protein
MNTNHLIPKLGFALLMIVAFFLTAKQLTYAQECRIIRILEEKKGSVGRVIRIEPHALQIAKGTCVIWINWARHHEVNVVFSEDGKKCQDMTDAPVGFKMVENCYLTDYIPLAGTSSLRFNEAGVFNYEVQVPQKKLDAGPAGGAGGMVTGKGKIVVE